jgi:hypothetical protein
MDRIPVEARFTALFQTGLLYNGQRVFPGAKERPGRGVDHPSVSSAKVKERVQLYLYSPCGSSWPVLGWTLTLPCTVHRYQTVECSEIPPANFNTICIHIKALFRFTANVFGTQCPQSLITCSAIAKSEGFWPLLVHTSFLVANCMVLDVSHRSESNFFPRFLL